MFFLQFTMPVGISYSRQQHNVIQINVFVAIFSIQTAGTGNQGGENKEKRRKESILDLSKYLEKTIRVKFAGGREAAGVLKGYDPLLNLVLDNTNEFLRDTEEPYKMCDETRSLGLVVCRGTSVVLICPQDGMESIQNPFIAQDA